MTDHAANLAAALRAMEQHAANVNDGYPPSTASAAWQPHREQARAALAAYDAARAAQAQAQRYRTASTPGLIIDNHAHGGPRIMADAMHPDFAARIVDALNAHDRARDSSLARPADADAR